MNSLLCECSVRVKGKCFQKKITYYKIVDTLQNKLICMFTFGDSWQAFQYFLASWRRWSSSNRKINSHVSLKSALSVFHASSRNKNTMEIRQNFVFTCCHVYGGNSGVHQFDMLWTTSIPFDSYMQP